MSEATVCAFCRLPMSTASHRFNGGDAYPYCCYGCELAERICGSGGVSGQNVWMLTRLGAGIVLSMAVMVFTLPLYAEHTPGTLPGVSSSLYEQLAGLMRYASLLLTTFVFVLLGLPIISSAWERWRAGVWSTDFLVVLGVGATLVYSSIATVRGSGATYFEGACMILVLVTVGRYLEALGKNRATECIRALESLLPDEVLLVRHGKTVATPRRALQPGDVMLVRDGEAMAADGVVVAGRSHVNESLVTGESEPVLRGVGDAVAAGTVNVDGALHVRVTHVGEASTIGRLTRILDTARAARGRMERLADRLARVFLPAVLMAAAIGAWLGHVRGGTETAVMTALAVLLISCPCALGIATPMAVWIAYGRAASWGAVVRSGEALETLARVQAVLFDKTGTLTSGDVRVTRFVCPDGGEKPGEILLAIAGGLASASTHVFSRSILDYVRREGCDPAPVTDVRSVPGCGVEGTVDGERWLLGSATFAAERCGVSETPPRELAEVLNGHEAQSVAFLADSQRMRCAFVFDEKLRCDASEALERLKALGLSVYIVTGDRAGRAEAIARELNVAVLAGQTPEEKCDTVRSFRWRHGVVAMVGDGLNDAPPLATADVGIALGCGTDLARDAASVCILSNQIAVVPRVIQLARRTMRTVRVNLFWAFVYNTAGIPLAIAGTLTPVFAALAMVVSSLFVVGNSLRLRT